jgi:hypothetical protein
MPWTNKQKQLAVRACEAAGINEAQRRDVILRHFANAVAPGGRITSTSAKLTSADFEQFMAIVEGHAGGKLLHFEAGYWQSCAGDGLSRMRYRALKLAEQLEATGQLTPGVGLAGWIEKRVTRGRTNQLAELSYHELFALINGLEAFTRQRAVAVSE